MINFEKILKLIPMKRLLFTFALMFVAFTVYAQTQIDGIYCNLDSSTKTA